MAGIREDKGVRHYIVIIALILITTIMMIPLFYIVNTSFRPWAEIKQYPPKLIYEPSIGSYVRVFTARTVYPPGTEPSQEELEAMKWYEKIVYKDTNEEVVRRGDLPKRYILWYQPAKTVGFLPYFLFGLRAVLRAWGNQPHRSRGV